VGYAEAKFSCHQAGMIKDWGEMEISKNTRFLPIIEFLLGFGYAVTTFVLSRSISLD